MKKTVVLCILDGLGISNKVQGNAFKLANTPCFDDLLSNYPNSILQASGQYVGLPKNQMGNSEVGHLNIGAGQVVYTGLTLISKAIENNEFKTNKAFLKAFNEVKKNNTTLHLIGLLSNGGVHSLEDHLFLLLDAAYENNVKNVSVHIFGDGRDVYPKSLINSITKLNERLNRYNYKLSSISGRFYSMDRDKMFDRIQLGYDALVGQSKNQFDDPIKYVNDQYDKQIYDEFIEPSCATNGNFIKDNDSIIFFNFRPDRARQLSHCFLNSSLYDYQPKNRLKINKFVSMMKYVGLDTIVAFNEMEIENPIGKVISSKGLKQLRLAETQKYAHVTFFMDGGQEIIYDNEDRKLIDSKKVKSYIEDPNMSAKEISDYLIENGAKYDLVIMNFANCDMVGHSGNLEATIKAIEFIDQQILRIKNWIESINGTLFISADHGNAEEMLDDNFNISTKHSSNPVFFISTDKNIKLKDGKLANIAPTILDYLNIEKPQSMDEESLIIK